MAGQRSRVGGSGDEPPSGVIREKHMCWDEATVLFIFPLCTQRNRPKQFRAYKDMHEGASYKGLICRGAWNT